jgi:hypothetical protein
MWGKSKLEKAAVPSSGYDRLEDQIVWYDRKSGAAQWWFKAVKLLQIICGGLVAVLAREHPYVTSGIGLLIIFFEGAQHLCQWHSNWISYRSTAEALKHEKFLFLGKAGPYERLEGAALHRALVERVEELVSTEHAKWVSLRESTEKGKPEAN